MCPGIRVSRLGLADPANRNGRNEHKKTRLLSVHSSDDLTPRAPDGVKIQPIPQGQWLPSKAPQA